MENVNILNLLKHAFFSPGESTSGFEMFWQGRMWFLMM